MLIGKLCAVLCRLTDRSGNFLLQNGSMNVQQPTWADLALTVPASWESHDGSAPPLEWLDSFWDMAAAKQWTSMPGRLDSILLVPLVGDILTTADICSAQPVLKTSHLQHFGQEQEIVAELLSEVGCYCIKDPRADFVSSHVGTLQEPITLALAAAATREGISLRQLISEQHLGTANFTSICDVLTKLNVGSCQQRVQEFLRSCALFEDISGAQLNISLHSDSKILPTEAWEQRIAATPDMFPWTVIKFHSADSTQRQLLNSAGFHPISITDFLNEDLLPEIYTTASTNLQSLLLQALDSMGAPAELRQPLQIFVKGRLHRIRTLVDSSSTLMRDLFARGSGYAGFDLLPGELSVSDCNLLFAVTTELCESCTLSSYCMHFVCMASDGMYMPPWL